MAAHTFSCVVLNRGINHDLLRFVLFTVSLVSICQRSMRLRYYQEYYTWRNKCHDSGEYRIRTDDPLLAGQVL